MKIVIWELVGPCALHNLEVTDTSNPQNAVYAQNTLHFLSDTLDYRPMVERWPSEKRGGADEWPVAYEPVLFGNYPDPFTEETTISFALPKGTEGVILLTDLSGRVLQQWPVNEQDSAIRLSGDDLPKGIYLLNLVVDGRVAGTDKMVLQ